MGKPVTIHTKAAKLIRLVTGVLLAAMLCLAGGVLSGMPPASAAYADPGSLTVGSGGGLRGPDSTPTVTDRLGVTRDEIVTWLKSHENDDYYLGTPYTYFYKSTPRGDCAAGDYPGMNCTGFVHHVLCAAHGWRDGIGDACPEDTGWSNLFANCKSYYFDTKEEMLASGRLQKGDIVWAFVVPWTANDNNHIGIYWPSDDSSSSEDRWWDSIDTGYKNGNIIHRGGNTIGEILPKDASQMWIVLKIDEGGSLALAKSSTASSYTANNTAYTLAGAVFGVYRNAACTNLAGTLTTRADGTSNTLERLQAGTYYIKETTAPMGFALDATVRTATVTAGQTTTVQVSDVPQSAPAGIIVKKLDPTTAGSQDRQAAQGAATLAGARFRIDWYKGVYSSTSALPAAANCSWVVQTNAQGVVNLNDASCKVSGPAFYTDSRGQIAFPLGTLTIVETAAPAGYNLDNGTSGQAPTVHLIKLQASGSAESVPLLAEPVVARDTVMRGNLSLVKKDAELGRAQAQGGATLAGAVYEVINDNDNPVVSPQTGGEVAKGAVVCEIVTGTDGRASTDDATLNGWAIPTGNGWDGANALAYGTYTVREKTASTGYLVNTGWSATFTIGAQGQQRSYETTEQVIRGDARLVKVQSETFARLAHIPFKITSKTTGEWHVAVTDDNGMLDTAASWNAHTHATNANDAAIREDGTVDDARLDDMAGVWFCGCAEETGAMGAAPDDGLGALPFDTYVFEELACAGNDGLALVTFEVTVKRNAVAINLGTVDDNPGTAIATTLADAQGEKTVRATTSLALVDTVAYENFTPGSYRMEGDLHLVGPDGTDEGIIATAQRRFAVTGVGKASGTVEVVFEVNASACAGKRLVAFERAYIIGADEPLAVHEDIDDEGQTVQVAPPSIGTTARDGKLGGHISCASDGAKIIDTVEYSGFAPGVEYTAVGTLHVRAADGSDGGALLDAAGKPVSAQAAFTPEEPDGQVEVTFEFDASALAGMTVVVFEEVSCDGEPYAAHADIADEGQTIAFPGLSTVARGIDTGEKSIDAQAETGIVDTVSFANLVPGETYTLHAIVHERNDAGADVGAVTGADGAAVEASIEFTAATATGTVEVPIPATLADLVGKTLVVFEELSQDGKTLAQHADIASTAQAVAVDKPVPPEPVPMRTPEPEQTTPAAKSSSPQTSALPTTGDPVLDTLIPIGIVAALSLMLAVAATAIAQHASRREDMRSR